MDIEYLEDDQSPLGASTGRGIEYLDGTNDDYWGDVRKHAVEGVKEFPGMVKGMAEQAGTIGKGMLPGSVIESAGQMLQGTSALQTPIGQAGKAAYELGKGAVGGVWQGVKDTGSLIKSGGQMLVNDELPLAETEIGQKFRERPISVPMGVAGTVAGLRGGFKALRGKPSIPEGGVPPESSGPLSGKMPYAGEMKLPEGMPETGASPIRPPSSRWQVDPGATPGEPTHFLDAGDDFGNAKAAIVEMQHESMPDRSYFVVMDNEGNQIGGNFADLPEATKYAESQFPPPGSGPGAGVPPESPPTGPGTPPPGGAVPPPPQTPMGTLEGFIKQFGETIKPRAEDLGRYINRTYQRAEQGGMLGNAADYTQEASQLMAVRAVGGNPNFAIAARRAGKTPMQISDELRGIGQYIIDEDIIRSELGDKHMIQTQQRLMDEAGGRIGGVRLMADQMAPPVNYQSDILQALQNQFGDKLSAGQYKEAVDIIMKHKPNYKGMADAATELNYEANQANRNNQPHTPFTNVANVISQINNERIMATVGPEVAKVYNSALNEFGVNKKIQNFLARKVGQGLHRIGPGTLKRAFVQKFFDEIGYKGGARVLNRMSGNIKANPSLVKNLPELFKSFINEVDDLLPDVEQKAFGGIVGEMDAYLTPKYGGVQ